MIDWGSFALGVVAAIVLAILALGLLVVVSAWHAFVTTIRRRQQDLTVSAEKNSFAGPARAQGERGPEIPLTAGIRSPWGES